MKTNDAPVGRPVYLINQGWHSGIVLHREDIRPLLLENFPEVGNSPWIEFGWGDRDFYLSSGYSYWQAFLAAFFSSSTVLQVSGLEIGPREFFPQSEVFRVLVSEEGLDSLNETFEATLDRGESGRAKPVAKSLYGTGRFYQATGGFSILRTCNSWTSEALNRAGCAVTPGLLRSSSLSAQLRKLERQQKKISKP